MYVVKGNRVCIMVQDTKKSTKYGYKWTFIPEAKWLRMTDQQRARYIV